MYLVTFEVQHDGKVPAIKAMRLLAERSGKYLGLKEAKDAIEHGVLVMELEIPSAIEHLNAIKRILTTEGYKLRWSIEQHCTAAPISFIIFRGSSEQS